MHSSARKQQELQLTIAGMVRSGIALDPQALNFGTVDTGKSPTQSIRVLLLSEQSATVKRIEANADYFDVATSRFRDGHRRGINLKVTLRPGVPVGELRDVITLHTDLERNPRIEILVLGDVRRGIGVEPTSHILGRVNKNSQLSRLDPATNQPPRNRTAIPGHRTIPHRLPRLAQLNRRAFSEPS